MSPVIETHSLTKSYGKSRGIEDVNLAVEKGEVFGFIGPNGAGKSTTIRTLLGFLKPTSGSAKVLGYDVVEESREIHKRIGYLPADVSLYDDMTAGELLDLSAKFHDVDGSDKIKELSSRLDLSLSKKFRSLSTGNKKKVGIIQTILHDPDLLIFDEPTSGLDPLVQNTFYEILRNEQDAGKTVFFSSHVLSEVQRLCNRVAIIREGKLVAVEELSEPGAAQYKSVRVRFRDPDVTPEFAGANSMEKTELGYKFMIQGDVNRLLGWLAGHEVEELTIEDPPLEEVFLNFYSGDDKTQERGA